MLTVGWVPNIGDGQIIAWSRQAGEGDQKEQQRSKPRESHRKKGNRERENQRKYEPNREKRLRRDQMARRKPEGGHCMSRPRRRARDANQQGRQEAEVLGDRGAEAQSGEACGSARCGGMGVQCDRGAR